MPAGELPGIGGKRALLDLARIAEQRLAGDLITQPLVLVSQVQRSGGTLLSQLLDGHPECHAHPHELKIGSAGKGTWPALDLAAAPEAWYDELHEGTIETAFRDGYAKPGLVARRTGAEFERFPLLLPTALLRALFLRLVAEHRPSTQRGVLDCYMTAFFRAWLDNHNLYQGPKRVVTAFRPALAISAAQVGAFFADYPDGTLVSIVREPCSWFASAARHAPERFGDLEAGLACWVQSVESVAAARERHGDRVIVLAYESLVRDTERVLRQLAQRIGIAFAPSLLVPTFNGMPIRPNSSFPNGLGGVRPEAADRRAQLDPATVRAIEERTGDVMRIVPGLIAG